MLGGLYFYGNGTPKNEKKGLRLLTEVAEENHAFAMETLGNLYMEKSDKKKRKNGIVVPPKPAIKPLSNP